VLRVGDPGGALAGVGLRTDRVLGLDRDFERDEDGWVLRAGRPPVARLEYRLALTGRDGDAEEVPDPGNPERATGGFGARSVLRFPGYAEPDWLTMPAPPGTTRALEVRARGLGEPVPAILWSPEGATAEERMPLLVAHDGPSYAEESALETYAAASIAARRLPRHRVALLSAPDREEWYSASARYARALCTDVVPALRTAAAVRGPVAGMGASLGALAMLHAQSRHAGCLGALFLQSGSFFHPRHDAHESGFRRYGRIVRFVLATQRAGRAADPVPVALTCGAMEENVHGNRLMTQALAARGHPARLHEGADLHNHTAWRDALHPHLTDLLAAAWRAP
jgi:enterochelin esterase-like enzyme